MDVVLRCIRIRRKQRLIQFYALPAPGILAYNSIGWQIHVPPLIVAFLIILSPTVMHEADKIHGTVHERDCYNPEDILDSISLKTLRST